MKWLLKSMFTVIMITALLAATVDFYNYYLTMIQKNTERRQFINYVSKISGQAQDLVGQTSTALEPSYIMQKTNTYFRKVNSGSFVTSTVTANSCIVNVSEVVDSAANLRAIEYRADYIGGGRVQYSARYYPNLASVNLFSFQQITANNFYVDDPNPTIIEIASWGN